MDDLICQSIAKIANLDIVKKECEPDVMFHEEIHSGIVKRVIKAWELLKIEYENTKT
jgi:hypothetical protein